jgi:superfamily I DNA/RNA helicase
MEYSDIAILARTNSIARQFADHLEASGIPVARRKAQETPADWSHCLLLLTLLANPSNDLVAVRYLVARDGQKKADSIQRLAAIAMKSINDYSLKLSPGSAVLPTLASEGISRESQERVSAAMLELSAAGDYSVNDLLLFLNGQEQESGKCGEGVHCNTIHQSKGQEYKICMLVGFEEGLCPMLRADSDLSEETRLAYVAITRAIDAVHISWCSTRPKAFSREIEERQPSRFISFMGLTS